MAETVHSETRDAVLPEEKDPFDALKDEIEFGIFAEKRKIYSNAVDKVDALSARRQSCLFHLWWMMRQIIG